MLTPEIQDNVKTIFTVLHHSLFITTKKVN